MQVRTPSLDGLDTLDELVERCAGGRYHGWTHVAYCSFLVARRFAHRRNGPEANPEESPEDAFERGAGTPPQRAQCLAIALNRLGIEAKVAQAQVIFDRHGREDQDPIDWAWVRATLDGETRDVSASDPDALPGELPFRPMGEIRLS